MKIAAIFLTAFFLMISSSPVCAEEVPAGDFCNPEKMEECKAKIDDLLKSLDALRANLQKSQLELKAGRKLTNEEADRMLKRMEAVDQSFPQSEGYLWDN